MISIKLLKIILPDTERFKYYIGSCPTTDKLEVKVVDYKYQGIVESINNYELANLCKLYVLENYGLTIRSWQDNKTNAIAKIYNNFNEILKGFQANTEPEAIFKATEWVFNETNTSTNN